ncbi:hypothetical protein EDL99_10140 [Ornithobacterium rhinotracheale]|uniref:hypothetical protein n=1 Tax=Ornithobacterium rhinotracheale TaxID=28251 RepID=UPI00129D11C5|nr:hypothetical protein [Ornithobacterium rhinotracheale]MRJ09216.1 hypothetical protein [Ornithobacterium rhinotracheale]UOH76980.1 hypothetical protein MT996_07050 [Ornithobacterium rhinotracheale]
MENSNTKSEKRVIIIKQRKSVGLSLLLTFFFGPLGMLYSTIWGAIIMLIISGIVGIITLGMGLPFIWPICMIWGALAARSYNNNIIIEE